MHPSRRRRKRFWNHFHAACSAIEADPVALADLQQQDAAWEATLADGLEEPPIDHGPRAPRKR